jgi:hypothetical protein
LLWSQRPLLCVKNKRLMRPTLFTNLCLQDKQSQTINGKQYEQR